MKISIRYTISLLLTLISWSAWGMSDTIEYTYFRNIPLIKSTNQLSLGRWENLSFANVDLSQYGYAGVSQYAIAAPTFTLFVLGVSQTQAFVLRAIDLTTRNMTIVAQFSEEELKTIRVQDINFAICFQDHPYSHERLRYVFLTYIVGSGQESTHTETYLKVFRMENDDSLTFTQMVFTKIGETDMMYANSPEAPYIYSRRDNRSEPGVQIVPRLMLADVDHDTFMDLVIWKRMYRANPRDAETPLEAHYAYEQHVFQGFTREREEVQVMFFEWETMSFAKPVTTQTEALGNDVFWRCLFPSYWIQEFYDWIETPPENPDESSSMDGRRSAGSGRAGTMNTDSRR